ncbi:hypothetical protein [Piscinibacter sp.]|uniref:hypothetical protein n=1 Tax=Piscinibacter sp. TaxID=1903157 RepID=UPI0039E6E2EF
MKHWSHLPTATPEARERIEAWFGSFTYTFTQKSALAEYDGGSWEAPYKVRSESENVITIQLLHVERREDITLYFDEPYFFLRSGSKNFEYFRRVAA